MGKKRWEDCRGRRGEHRRRAGKDRGNANGATERMGRMMRLRRRRTGWGERERRLDVGREEEDACCAKTLVPDIVLQGVPNVDVALLLRYHGSVRNQLDVLTVRDECAGCELTLVL